MNFEPNEDLATFLTFVERLGAKYKASFTPGHSQRFLYSEQLDGELEQSGFFGCATESGLGLPAATSMVYELATLSVCAEVAASCLVAPFICPDLPRPLAVVWGEPRRPTRFLPVARAVVSVRDDGVWAAQLREGDVSAADSLFAYPMGTLDRPDALPWRRMDAHSPQHVRDLWSLGVCAEITGCLQSGLDSVVSHVTERRQFGRPLGSFQAIQHRLAECAGRIQGARWLLLKAAHTATRIDAAMALGYAQGMSTKVVYDLHQFMGAMGLTLEHPLHRWTYRARLLRSDLGGSEHNLAALADLAWPTRAESVVP